MRPGCGCSCARELHVSHLPGLKTWVSQRAPHSSPPRRPYSRQISHRVAEHEHDILLRHLPNFISSNTPNTARKRQTYEPSRRQRHQSRYPRARSPGRGSGRPCRRSWARRETGNEHRAGRCRKRHRWKGWKSWRRGLRAWAWPRRRGQPWGRPWARETRLRRL